MPEIRTSPSQASQPRNRLWLHWAIWLFLILIVFLPVFIVIGINVYNRQKADRELKEAIAETDRLDPGWRLEEIEKRRTQLPREENAAIHVLDAAAKLPVDWTVPNAITELVYVPPQVQIDPGTLEPLRTTLAPLLPALPLAQKTLPLKKGYYVIAWTPDAFSTLVPDIQKVRNLTSFLRYLVMLQIHDGKHDEAWQTSLTILAVGRSFGEDPLVISQLVRKFNRTMAVESLERCLAQGKVADSLLAEALPPISQEVAEPILYHGIHGERGGMHNFFLCLEVGNVSKSAFPIPDPTLLKRLDFFVYGNTYKDQHTWALRYMNDAVAASKLSPREQLRAFSELDDRSRWAPAIAKVLVTAFSKLVEANVRSIAHLNCAQTAIAVERFRLKNNRWPELLDEVVAAKLLDKVPEDPYDGKPLRYRKTSDGVVVYSIGKDGTYAGDAVDAGRPYDSSVIRYEFRLWDEAHRRQPPRPKAEQKKDGGEY